MQFMILLSRDPGKAATPTPADLRETEFQRVRGFYAEGFLQQIWLRGDTAGACMIVEAGSARDVTEKLNTLPLVQAGFLQPPVVVPLKPYSGFAPRPE
jgi:uncharacterized protein YciI